MCQKIEPFFNFTIFVIVIYFLPTLPLHIFYLSQIVNFPSQHHKMFIISSSPSQSSSKFNSLFNNENICAETETKLYFISSIWDDDQIIRLDENNWQCLWCDTSFQEINDTKALHRVLGKKVVHIKSCYVTKDKAHIKNTKGFSNKNRIRRVFFLNIQKI